MRKSIAVSAAVLGLMLGLSAPSMAEEKSTKKESGVLDFTMKTIDGKDVKLSEKYAGKVVLIVNVASKCGNTPQYKDLEALHEKYGEQGLAILGFPANEFGGQEPGSDKEIKGFCEATYGVKFDMFSKIVVKGEGQHPLYKFLTDPATDPKFPGPIGWNFEKFLIARDGSIVGRIKPGTKPSSPEVIKAIEAELAKK
jgi:glutathione peroxidase